MTLASPRPRPWTRFAVVPVLALVATFASQAGTAWAVTAVRHYVPALSPGCVKAGTTVQLTATITNDTSSNKVLGSALFDNEATTGFSHVGSFGTPVASAGKAWLVAGDSGDADALSLHAANPASTNALAPGQTVSVTFFAKAASSTGTKHWTTKSWQSNAFSGARFSLAAGAAQPTVKVASTCGAASIQFTQAPPAEVGEGGTISVQVQVLDGSNNPLNGETVQLSSDDPSIGTPSAVTSGSGTATFTNLPVGNDPGDFTLTATDGALTTSAPFSVVPGPIDHLEFVQQPTDTLAGDTIAPAVSVQEVDASGHVLTNDNTSTISMAIGTNPGSSTLTGGGSTTVVNGVATFNSLSLDKSSSGYTLVATYDPNPSITQTSDPFDIVSAQNNDCSNGCSATATNPDIPTSSVTVDAGAGSGSLSIVYEAQPLDCGSSTFSDIGGTVTINPPSGAPLPITVTFDDTISKPVQDDYPVCKTVEQDNTTTTELVPFCSDIPDGLDKYGQNPSNNKPCIQSQTVTFHGANQPTLKTVVLITTTDPVMKH